MQTDGEMGEIPDWYRTIIAAQELNVAPWDLAEQPMVWQEWALSARRIRAHIDEDRAKRQERATKRGSSKSKH